MDRATSTTCTNGHPVLAPHGLTTCHLCGALLSATRGEVPTTDLRDVPAWPRP